MQFRVLVPNDARHLAEIDRSATAYPWTLCQFESGLSGSEFGWGLENSEGLVAFALFNQVLDEATLLNVAVDPRWQRKGLAHALLIDAIRRLVLRGVSRCLLEVRAGNRAAIALYERLGFERDGLRRNYYPADNGREDALLMSLQIQIP
jgi:ribosomal-protein-alanine N-acetyltransferase